MGPGIGHYGYSRDFIPWLKKNRSRFDAVIIHGIWQYHSAGTWLALKGTETPYYVLPQGMLDPWFKKQHPAKHLKKWAYWKLIEKRVFRDARRILFTCKKESLLAFKCFKPCKTPPEITSLGVRTPEIPAAEARGAFIQKYPYLNGKRILLYIGRIDSKKGIELLIEAFKYVMHNRGIDDLNLLIAGPCSKASYLEALQAQAKGSTAPIHFLPMLSGALKWGSFYSAEALIVPTHQENFGLVFAEAMACSLPVLTTTGVNIAETIESSGAGFIEPDTVKGIQSLLNRWLDLNLEGKALMRIQAHNCFKQHFEIHTCAERLIQTIHASL
jgi:glycosyltransferase involved in cell wall biosynthesis